MAFEAILYDVADGVATITFNRPEKLNAYVPEMGNETVEAFARAKADDAVGAVVVTGAGRGFCAGVDLERLKQGPGPDGKALGDEAFVKTFAQDVYDFPKPTIAAINGAAIGVGITFIVSFDLRIAAAGAKLAVPFTKLGMLPGLGSSHLLPQLIGASRASDLVLTGRTVLAEEALELGLVNRVVPGEELMDTVRELAKDLASRDPRVMAAAKRLLHAGLQGTVGDAMKNEQAESAALRRS